MNNPIVGYRVVLTKCGVWAYSDFFTAKHEAQVFHAAMRELYVEKMAERESTLYELYADGTMKPYTEGVAEVEVKP